MTEFILTILGVIWVIHLQGEYRGNKKTKFITKPLLIPIIALYVIMTRGYANNHLLLAALFCGFAGDIALMWESKRKFFKIGLISFLIGHIIYIYLSLKIITDINVSKQNGLLLLVLIVIGAVSFLTIRKKLSSLSPLVIAYISTILILLFISINIYQNGTFTHRTELLAGTVLFAISDSLLAQWVFNKNIPKAPVLIMATYVPAQLLIILSLIN
ncbi:MAG: lysoplasmalogenase [Bacteroidales bacterium]|nr:lysoplasmalogenase [Bacteroidales bacterium]